MNDANPTPRRQRVPGERNSNIYKRYDSQFEVGFRDSSSKQRWVGPFGTITAARAIRDEALAKKGKGETVSPNPRLKFGDAADRWWNAQATKLRPSTQNAYGASLKHL